MQPCPKVLTKKEWIEKRLEVFPNETYAQAEKLHDDIRGLIYSPSSRTFIQQMIKNKDF